MIWRLAVLGAVFFGVSQVWREDRPGFRVTCAVIHNRSNGHYYQCIPAHASFDKALAWADECRFAGARGHLATLATPEEQAFYEGRQDFFYSLWIAATDRDQEGIWKWVAGDEAGTTFFVAGQPPKEEQFSAWHDGEPNNRNEEDYAVAGCLGGPKWNDAQGEDGSVRGFLVEYSGLPEPDKLIVTSGNTHSPFFGYERPTILGEKNGQSWQW